jgi:hypothetical protein
VDDQTINVCAQPSPDRVPDFAGISGTEGLRIDDHLFLPSLLPCCAQLALPYWAKVTGDISNDTDSDLAVVVSVALLDGGERVVERYSDRVLLDAGERSNFEVKLVEFRDKTVRYRIEIDASEAP